MFVFCINVRELRKVFTGLNEMHAYRRKQNVWYDKKEKRPIGLCANER